MVVTTIPYSGAATPAVAGDIFAAARLIGCDAATVMAVEDVETGGLGGFLPDGSGRPRILFEAQLFSQATGGQYDTSHPTISCPVWKPSLYVGGSGEYVRLEQAAALDATAAVTSASWGMFQVLGSNYRACGFSSVDSFLAGMEAGEGPQITAFARYCINTGLAPLMADRDWINFSRRYNGPSYRANGYPQKLAAAYQRNRGQVPVTAVQGLAIGAVGPEVAKLQALLVNQLGITLVTDGRFGASTQLAVRQFQESAELEPDGIAGPDTLAALGLPTPTIGT